MIKNHNLKMDFMIFKKWIKHKMQADKVDLFILKLKVIAKIL